MSFSARGCHLFLQALFCIAIVRPQTMLWVLQGIIIPDKMATPSYNTSYSMLLALCPHTLLGLESPPFYQDFVERRIHRRLHSNPYIYMYIFVLNCVILPISEYWGLELSIVLSPSGKESKPQNEYQIDSRDSPEPWHGFGCDYGI